MKPILITPDVAETVLNVRLPDGVQAVDVFIKIVRAGLPESDWSVVYPAKLLRAGELVFAWDSVLWSAPSGRYLGYLLGCGGCDVCVPFDVQGVCAVDGAENVLFSC